ncbi:uncharacterized protein EI97DRAFT_396570 [Westerdykella ornata]|uniref:Uncharacterized protein n=1 Tax=Westerdykella ornata TaxID=318751 RepID=A0A6A6JMA9_WESOR|nr:uncharacterized protein EI97DRAFT_396570 [Westerdykella ornata]KAF2277632.1 hypothetical protein EI97DRAFT_396570 [Westerdykella ornata]
MPRKSLKVVPAPRNSSKRAAPEKPAPTRQSKRARATPAKLSYKELESDDDVTDAGAKSEEKLTESIASDYEEQGNGDDSSEPEEEEQSSDEDAKPTKVTPRRRPEQDSDADLWKPGAKLAPGTQVIIKKPKAREAGETPYEDHTIHPNTMLFLKDLAANNERKWLRVHDPDYRAALNDFTTFLEVLSEKVAEADDTIPELPIKDIIFRIYRDVRFSKDQTPYKTYFSAAWSRTGRKGPYAAYYVQIKPEGGSFVGGGLWCPDARPLSLLRRDIDRKPHKIKAVLTNSAIRKDFLGGVADDAKQAVRAFVNLPENKSNALKKNPKGYDKEHADIELLRLKNFTLGTKLSDDEVVGSRGLERIAGLIASMVPFITYLNSIVMPDEAESSGSSEQESGGDDSAEEDGGDA